MKIIFSQFQMYYGFLLIFSFFNQSAIGQSEFITTWKTDNIGPSDDFSIAIPLAAESYYDFDINWGDNSSESFVGLGADLIVSHTYSNIGTYTVSIDGNFPRIYFNFSGDRQKLLTVNQWGAISWENFDSAFRGCSNLQVNALDIPDLTNVTSLRRMFRSASVFNGSINDWQVSTIIDMSEMFHFAIQFNQPLNSWDVSGVTNMSGMFTGADSFNQPISNWDVSNVTTMSSMFIGADSFNQSIDNWDVSNVTNMSSMFSSAVSFNQPLNNWDVSSVTDLSFMFQNAQIFNQPLGSWQVGAVTTLKSMFSNAYAFNQPIGDWDVSNVTTTADMFHLAVSFNQPIGSWNVSNVTNMGSMFWDASAFNQSIENWDVSQVTQFGLMFQGASSFNQPLDAWNVANANANAGGGFLQMFAYAESFNQPLNSWNVGNVTNMKNMFRGATVFNQPLNNWDVSNVADMVRMFEGALAFDQSLGSWNITSCWDFTEMLSNSGLSYCNYDETLQSWAAQSPNYAQPLGAIGLEYTASGAPARFQLVDTYQWTITGDVLVVPFALEVTSTINGTEMSVLASGGTGNYTYLWTGPNGFESTDSSIVAPQNGIYTVIVSDGCNQWSDSFEILTVGIKTQESVDLMLFPNPTNGLLNVRTNKIEGHEIELMDSRGKTIYRHSPQNNNAQIDLSNFEQGLYLLRLIDKHGGEDTVKRVVVVR
jgi:surface protein